MIRKTTKNAKLLSADRFDKKADQLTGMVEDIRQRLNKMEEQQTGLNSAMVQSAALLEQLKTALNTQNSSTQAAISAANATSSEALWAHIFNNTIAESTWLINKAFSPGRWAIGYPFLYVLYKILDLVQPKSIIELGLGQSTKMISQYATTSNAIHAVVEHDKSWINFFSKEFPLPEQTKITHLDLTERGYLDASKINAYRGFREAFIGKKYDLVSVDGPYGTLNRTYSRIDILDILPDCLYDSFVILIDDYNRDGEKRTALEVSRMLTQARKQFRWGFYNGQKSLCVIASADLGFLCSL